MEVTRIRALRGPNLWTRHTAIEAMVRCAPGLESDLSADHQAFEKRLRHLFPGLGRLQPGERDAHLSMAHALEAVALHLQIQAGCPVTFSRTTATPEEGLFQVVVEYTVEQVGKLAMQLSEQLCLTAFGAKQFDVDKALQELQELDEDIRLGPSTGAIVDAALARGIPYRRLTDASLVQFGWGSKQRRIQAAETDASSAIAESIAQDKELSKKNAASCRGTGAAGPPCEKRRRRLVSSTRNWLTSGSQTTRWQPRQRRGGQHPYPRRSHAGVQQRARIP